MIHLNTEVEKNMETLKLTVRYIHDNRNRKKICRRIQNLLDLSRWFVVIQLRESEKVIYLILMKY